jgi:exodeoxyribonuclease I
LDPRAQIDADVRFASRLLDDSGGPLTLHRALAETDKLMADRIGDPSTLLADYRDYLLARVAKIAQFRADKVA